jgi:hypothetical protein
VPAGRLWWNSDLMDLSAIFAANFLMAVLSVPFLWDLVPRNRLYGFRVAATLRDDRVWYAMNRRVARETIPVAVVLAVLAALFDRLELDTPTDRALLTVITAVAMGIIVVRAWIAANRLARRP